MLLYTSFLGGGGGAGGGGGDPHFANVVLLVGFNGADGSTTFTDESSSAHTLTAAGDAQVDTAVSKFDGGSLLCDGAGDWVTAADSDNWYLPGQFTIEAWARPNFSGIANGSIIGQWLNINPHCNFNFFYNYGGATSKRFGFTMDADGNGSAATTVTPAASNIDQSVFHHVAVDRDSSDKIRLYVDGVMVASATLAGGANAGVGIRIGDRGAGDQRWNGWIDELRVTKGVARYASDGGLTVPTAAFPRS